MGNTTLDNFYALLIGVGGKNFETTIKDATDIYNILIDAKLAGYPPKNVKLLTGEGATNQAVEQELDHIISKTASLDNATVFIYYSGHGGQYKKAGANGTDANEYFLKTWGAKEYDKEKTMLNGNIFSQKIDAIRAGKLIILLDCCHAAGIRQKNAGLVAKGIADEEDEDQMTLSGTELIRKLNSGKGRVFISSCADNEESVILRGADNSLFTDITLEALKGSASGADPFVKVIDLMYHILREVPARIKKFDHQQNPVINEVKDLNADYIVCRNSLFKERSLDFVPKSISPVADAEEKQKFIDTYPQVIKNVYHQKIINNGAVGKQINIEQNSGDITM